MNSQALKVIIVLALIAIAAAFISQLEKVERTINEGPNLNVRKNNFYAAGKFLESQGLDVTHSTSPVSLMELAENESLLLTNSHIFEEEHDISSLLDWVASGGNLIFQHNDEENYNPIASYFDLHIAADDPSETYKNLIQSYYERRDEQRDKLNQDQLRPKQLVRANIQLTESSLPDQLVSNYIADESGSSLALFIESPISIEHSLINNGYSEGYQHPLSLVTVGGNSFTNNIATFTYGQGRISVITDASIWSNSKIGHFDHAHLLVKLTEHSKKISIQRFVSWPSLDKLIIKYAPELSLSLLLILAGWLLNKSQRFGPIKPGQNLDRRALQEHIQAVANFHYQHGHHNHLLSPLRKEIRLKMQKRNGAFMQLTELQQFTLISDLSGIEEGDIIFAMREADKYTDNQLFDLIKLLTNIRNAL